MIGHRLHGPEPTPAAAVSPHTRGRLARGLTWGAVVGPVVLTVGWVVLGLLFPAVKTAFGVQGGLKGTITSPISGIAVGPHGAWFTAAFIVSGLVTIVGVAGVFLTLDGAAPLARRRNTAIALALSPLGYVVAGIFSLRISVPLHMLGFLLVAGTPIVTFVIAGRFFRSIPNRRRFGVSLLIGAPLTLILTVWFFLSYDRVAIVDGQGLDGIPSRLLALELGAYYLAMAWLTLRRPPALSARGA